MQTGFRFLLNKTLAFSASLIKTEGGAYRINEYEWSKPNDIRRYQLGIYQFFSKDSVALQYGGDISTEHGLHEKYRWNVRWTRFF